MGVRDHLAQVGQVEGREVVGAGRLPAVCGVAEHTVRGQWRGDSRCEHSLHWVLDNTFQEDRCHLHTGHAARHMAALRCIALKLLAIPRQFRAKDVDSLGGPQPHTTGTNHGSVATCQRPGSLSRTFFNSFLSFSTMESSEIVFAN